jgi:thymidylate kinase
MMDDRCRVARFLLDFFERSGVPCCVVGDTRGFLEAIPSDVDIVVPHEAFAVAPRLIGRFCREHDMRLVQLIQHEQTACYFVLAWAGEPDGFRFLAADICSDYLRGGRRLLTAEEILAQREPAIDESGVARGFCVPPPHVRFIYYLLKKIDKQHLDDSHGDYLSGEWWADPSCAWREICRFWPAPEDTELLAHAAAHNEWAVVRGALPRLRRRLHRAVPRSFRGLLGEVRRRAARVLQPTGLVVTFLGPDGCGKSTVIERMLEDLVPVFRRTGYFHLRPRAFSSSGAVPIVVKHPHALPARGVAASLAKLAYFFFDYLVGYALRVWPHVVCSTLVAFDRYYHDLLVDPRRYRYGGPMALARWIAGCVPAPDLWILLDAPPAVLQARKNEVTFEESERQRSVYRTLVKRRWNAFVVDASQETGRVVAEVEIAVLRFMEQRLEQRFRQLRFKENPASARLLLFFCRRRVPVLSRLVRLVFNSDIYCRIRSPFIMPHPYGVVIHSRAEIGNRVTVMQQVTIGGKNPDENVAPVLEDDVYVGAGAKILGAVRVGRSAMIGANAVVTRDVPPFCTVVGANRVVYVGGPGRLDAYAQPEGGGNTPRREPLSA